VSFVPAGHEIDPSDSTAPAACKGLLQTVHCDHYSTT